MTGHRFERSDRVAGVLYAEDFDFIPEQDLIPEPVNVPENVPEIVPDLYTIEDLETARRSGEETGRQEGQVLLKREREDWKVRIEQRSLDVLEKINLQAEEAVRNISEKAVAILLAQMAALFPSCLEQTGRKERDAILEKIIPSVRKTVQLRIEAPSDDMNYLSDLFIRAGAVKVECQVNDDLAAGDFRFSWADGSAYRNAGQTAQDILSELQVF